MLQRNWGSTEYEIELPLAPGAVAVQRSNARLWTSVYAPPDQFSTRNARLTFAASPDLMLVTKQQTDNSHAHKAKLTNLNTFCRRAPSNMLDQIP